MTIRPLSHDTCAKCWKYRNKLGVMSRLKNEAARQQICNDFNGDNQLEDEDSNMNDEYDSNNRINNNSTNTQVENYIALKL